MAAASEGRAGKAMDVEGAAASRSEENGSEGAGADNAKAVKVSKSLSVSKKLWKARPTKRTSSMGRRTVTDWQKRKRKREQLGEMKRKQRAYMDRVRAEREKERRKREQRRQYKEEQAKKNEVVQVIKDPKKIKKMKNKHLRYIAKR